MLVSDHFHLSYCTNIHPGQDWDTTFQSIKEYVPIIKQALAPDRPFGIGLRLSNKASEELDLDHHLTDFKEWLDNNHVYVFTLNGFPYGNFHNERVKENVHAPDWTTVERLHYTQRLFRQLAILVPEGATGGISTSPIGYKHNFNNESDLNTALSTGAEQMIKVVAQLYNIEKTTGTYLHLDIEPEPDGLLENSDELISFFNGYLLPVASKELPSLLGIPESAVNKMVKRYITLCYDICHFSLAYEEPEDTFKKLKSEEIQVGKIQVSAALKIRFNGKDDDEIWKTLEAFDEPTYLHQVTEKIGTSVKTYPDLPEVLKHKKKVAELRAHFHVPIFLERFGKLYSTQDHIVKTLRLLGNNPISEHLEVETYTWDVLPKALKEDLATSIIRELHWCKSQLEE